MKYIKPKRYNEWAGNPDGNLEITSRCIVEVMDGYHFYQCQRNRGHGVDGLFCKQHSKTYNEVVK